MRVRVHINTQCSFFLYDSKVRSMCSPSVFPSPQLNTCEVSDLHFQLRDREEVLICNRFDIQVHCVG